jgi:hypothetical protein
MLRSHASQCRDACIELVEIAELGVSAGLSEIPHSVSGKNLDFAVRWESRM